MSKNRDSIEKLRIAATIDDITVQTTSTYSSDKIEDELLERDSSTVHNTGNETIAGIKTFSSSPIVPTPTTNTQAANKEYVDTKQTNLGFTPVQQGTGIGQLGNAVKIGWSGARTKITIDGADMGNIVMDSNIGVANSSLVMSALNATGSAPIYACRAWVNFNGTGTVAIRASGNVSSITDNGTGNYTINFTTAMPDTYYSVCGMVRDGEDDFPGVGIFRKLSDTKTTTQTQIETLYTSSWFDVPEVNVMIFR